MNVLNSKDMAFVASNVTERLMEFGENLPLGSEV
jgi:hypothetical protein